MSHTHVERILADWNVGAPAQYVLADVAQLGLSYHSLVNLSDEYTFLPEGSYCPWSDTPDWALTVGVHQQGPQVAVIVDNGMCGVCWLLSR